MIIDVHAHIAPASLLEAARREARADGARGACHHANQPFARRHGGDLTIRSAPGQGAVVTLRLPLGTGRSCA